MHILLARVRGSSSFPTFYGIFQILYDLSSPFALISILKGERIVINRKGAGITAVAEIGMQYKNDQWCKEKSTDLRLEIWVQNLFLPLVSHGHLALAFPSLSLKVG